MAKWDGFSEEDIQKVRACERLVEGPSHAAPTVCVTKHQANVAQHSGVKNVTRARMLQKSHELVEPNSNTENFPKEAFLCKPQALVERDSSGSTEMGPDSGCGVSSSTEMGPDSGCGVSSSTSSPDTSPSHGTVCLRIKEGKTYEVLGAEEAGSSCSLDEFQSRQKFMEEQNRLKKELLSKVLDDRKKQTTAEATKLQQIQDELQKLDTLLSNDVSLLRDQIEVASQEFMEAQKRYKKAEKEFLDAKLHLFERLERKELLTEHLCTIIEQNEIRKARKLSELMNRLQPGRCEGDFRMAAGNVVTVAGVGVLSSLDTGNKSRVCYCGTGIQGSIMAVVIREISGSDSDINVSMWRFDICGNEICEGRLLKKSSAVKKNFDEECQSSHMMVLDFCLSEEANVTYNYEPDAGTGHTCSHFCLLCRKLPLNMNFSPLPPYSSQEMDLFVPEVYASFMSGIVWHKAATFSLEPVTRDVTKSNVQTTTVTLHLIL
ncbi:hypothetical protein Cfor_02329 [Coptotermes formosanus]|uniref:RAB6-interacting golgin n=1 Tax=Coptotermes formosanus TaxID=36987 RepID=A0A6L2Q5E8_COPFO|nr:hypothetical protein Cfor_02329 [Coptotermes formosanus]